MCDSLLNCPPRQILLHKWYILQSMSLLTTGHKINIDIGNHCNLQCPHCMRQSITREYNKKNKTNLKQHPFLNTISVTVDDVKRWFSPEFLQERVKIVEFCGSLAEPTLNPYCIDLVKYFAEHVDIVSISSNGDTRTPSWWKELAQSADNLVVRFYPDSLKSKDASLNRHSEPSRIIENLKAFTSAGGEALLSHVIFKHNQDEIDDFKFLAREANCNYRMFAAREFTTDDTFTSYEAEYEGEHYLLEKNTLIESNPSYKDLFNSTDPHDYCSLTHEKIIRVFSNGLVLPCCHHEGELFEIYENFFMDENNTKPIDIHPQITKDFVSKIELQGGIKTISLKYNTIEEIMNSNFYRKTLQMSWKLKSNKTCLNCINGTRVDIAEGNEINNLSIPNIPKAG